MWAGADEDAAEHERIPVARCDSGGTGHLDQRTGALLAERSRDNRSAAPQRGVRDEGAVGERPILDLDTHAYQFTKSWTTLLDYNGVYTG